MKVGTKGSDILFSSTSEDHFFFGLEGDDRVGDDKFVSAVPTNDRYYGNEGDDRLYSYTGDDWLYGNTGSDIALIHHRDGKVRFDGGNGFDVANFIGFSEGVLILEKGNRSIIIDDDCKVVMRDVEDWNF